MSNHQGNAVTHNNPNIIITLVGRNHRTHQVWADPHNKKFYLPPLSQATHGRPREVSVDPKNRSKQLTKITNQSTRIQSSEPALQITFNKKPRNPELGYLLGSDRRLCDIFLGSEDDDSIGERMFTMSFNRYNEVTMTSLPLPMTDIVVSYGKQKETRKNFTWMFPSDQKEVVVKAGPEIKFTVEVPTHDTDKLSYESNCQDFLKLVKSASRILNQLDHSSQLRTGLKSETTTSQATRIRPVYLRTVKLGEGGFGKVHKARSMPDGRTVAVKRFKCKKAFALEADILRKVSKTPHDNIIEFIGSWLAEKPYLVMGLAPGGNLEDQHKLMPFKIREIGLILSQMLDALEFLHVGNNIIHCDVKSINILCNSRVSFKLADFGLASEGPMLRTRKGTKFYFAPEMFSNQLYTAAVDLWALGLVIVRFLTGGFPRGYREDEGPRWCAAVVKHFQDYKQHSEIVGVSELEQIALTRLVHEHMLRMKPEERGSATGCLEQGDFLWWMLNYAPNNGSNTSSQDDQEEPSYEELESEGEPISKGKENELLGENESSGNDVSEAETELLEARPLNTNEWMSLERDFGIKGASSEEIKSTLGVSRQFVDAGPVSEPEDMSKHSTTPSSSGPPEDEQDQVDTLLDTVSPTAATGTQKPLLKRKRSALSENEATGAMRDEAKQLKSEQEPSLDHRYMPGRSGHLVNPENRAFIGAGETLDEWIIGHGEWPGED